MISLFRLITTILPILIITVWCPCDKFYGILSSRMMCKIIN